MNLSSCGFLPRITEFWPRIALFLGGSGKNLDSMKKLEHIGIAVRDLAAATELFRNLLSAEPYKEEKVESEGVNTVFFRVGDVKIELLGALSEASPLNRFLEHHGQGVHHLAFHTEDISKEASELASKGFRLTSDSPKDGADNKLVQFIHPRSAGGVLVELCQDKP